MQLLAGLEVVCRNWECRSLLGSGGLLHKHSVGLLNTVDEVLEVGQVALNLMDGQVDQHTGDLGRGLLTHLAQHEVKDRGADLVLVVGVDLVDSVVDRHNAAVELGRLRVLRRCERHLGLDRRWHWHRGLARCRHGLGLRGLTGLLIVAAVVLVVTAVTLIAVVIAVPLMSAVALVHALTLAHVATLVTLAVGTAAHGQTLALHGTLVAALHRVHQKAQDGRNLLVGLIVEVLKVLSLVALEVLLVLGALILNLTLLLHLVVADVERLRVERELLVLDSRRDIRSLEAHERVGVLAIASLEEAERLNFTVGAEQIAKVVLCGVRVKVLDEKVAALLRGLVLKSLVGEHLVTVRALQGLLNVKLLVTKSGAIHFFAGLSRAVGSVLAIHGVIVAIADESVHAEFVGASEEGLDLSECGELLPNLRLFPVIRNVLDVDVVEGLAEVALVFGRELDTDNAVAVRGLRESTCAGLRVFEADEAVGATGVVLVQGDLAGLDLAVFGEGLFEVLVDEVLGDFAHKNVLVGQSGDVGSEQVLLVGQCADGLSVELEVAQFLGHLLELVIVVDLDQSRVEGLVGVAPDLGHLLKVVAGDFFDGAGEEIGRAHV